jgi:hypothetical protein
MGARWTRLAKGTQQRALSSDARFVSSFVYLVVRGGVKDLSFKGPSNFSILAGEQEDQRLSFIKESSLFWARFFTFWRFIFQIFAVKTAKKPQNKAKFVCFSNYNKKKSLLSILRLGLDPRLKQFFLFSHKNSDALESQNVRLDLH